nr:OFA family MFS transporter [uncultured Desulfuromonas sp.]
MKNKEVCPYFRKDEDICDVGCGHISAHDVRMIIDFCDGRYAECSTYQLLEGKTCPEPIVEDRVTTSLPMKTTKPMQTAVASQVQPFNVKWPSIVQLRAMTAQYNESFNYTQERKTMTDQIKNKGMTVVLAATGINLALGILYTWSIFKGAIADSIAAGGPGAFTWDKASINDPYAVACLAFAVSMIIAGKLQQKYGPRVTCILGGLLVGAGFVWISQTTNYWAWILGFGVMAGMGIGFGYSATTPPALKWFSPAKTGLIAGTVVSGFGLASIYIAPLAKHLLATQGLQQSMLIFGIAFAIVVSLLGMLISNPPEGFVPAGAEATASTAKSSSIDMTATQMMKTPKFYILWTCFFIGAGAGLMVIGSAKGLAKASMGEMAFLVVAIMSVGNAAGRLIAGVVSDKVGRANTLTFMLMFQAVLMFAAVPVLGGTDSSPILVVLLVSFMVFNYGTNLSLFPSFAKDLWGAKNLGMNYGILFSAWGVGAFVLVRLSQMMVVKTGSFDLSFKAAGIMLLVGAGLSLTLRAKQAVAEAPQTAAVLDDEYDEEDLVVD